MRKPLIAIGGRWIRAGRIAGWRDAAAGVAGNYVDALRRAGGQEAIISPQPLNDEDASELVTRFDGLMLTGGGDIDPARYGAEKHHETAGVSDRRDGFELPLVRAALDREMPVLAICRGMQVLNVALGGTLHQHVPDLTEVNHRGDDTAGAIERVKVEPGSKLAKALETETVDGSGWHHQAVDRLGEGLKAVAWAEDGLVEGVELEDGWVVAVQWHPERSAESDPVQQKLFEALVDQSRP